MHPALGSSTTLFSPPTLPRPRNVLSPIHNTAGHSSTPPLAHQTPMEWPDPVEMYANCDPTKEEDKLIAFSGLTRRLWRRANEEWCAGLWNDRICEGLL